MSTEIPKSADCSKLVQWGKEASEQALKQRQWDALPLVTRLRVRLGHTPGIGPLLRAVGIGTSIKGF